MPAIALLLFLSLLFSGCGTRMEYDTLHNMAKQNCRNIPNPDERRACEAKHNTSYDLYRARETYPEGQ